jgi:hypothetical protein
MGIDGRNTLEVRGPDEIINDLEKKGFVLDTEDTTLNHIAERFFGSQNIYVKHKDDRYIVIGYEFRNKPVYNYLTALLERYPKCWLKNTYTTETGDCGLWIARMSKEKPIIQELEWIELCDEEVMMGEDFSVN